MPSNDINVYSTNSKPKNSKNKLKGILRDSSHSIPLSVVYHVGHIEQAVPYWLLPYVSNRQR